MSDLLTRITINPEIRRRKAVIRGTRITVTDVLEYMAGGMTLEEILEDFPELAAEDIQAVLAYAALRDRRIFSHDAGPLSGSVVTISPEIMSGMPVFTGTRVPVESLIQHLSAGDTLDDFLDGFPGVSRKQATGFLRLAFDAAIASFCR